MINGNFVFHMQILCGFLELCGTSASLQCGKRVQSLIEGQTELSVHMKCDLRDVSRKLQLL